MKPIIELSQAQIDITSRCVNACSNCHHGIGHFKKPWTMTLDQFKAAVDSYSGFPGHTVGVIGGEPLLVPDVEKYFEYMRQRLPREKCGLWTCLPKGKEHLREDIAATFGQIFINSHERDDVLHTPVLVASEEIEQPDWWKENRIWNCWIARDWSPSVTPHGCFRCETMGALSMLFGEEGDGWPVEHGWWLRQPFEYKYQSEKWCKMCGAAFPLLKRASTEGPDDVSPKMLERLVSIGSPKVKAGKFVVHDCKTLVEDNRPCATYKDESYRAKIAARYGLFLTTVPPGYHSPNLLANWSVSK